MGRYLWASESDRPNFVLTQEIHRPILDIINGSEMKT